MGIEGQGWDEMIADQHWQVAADVASSVVAEVVAVRPEAPVVVNVNVPNLPSPTSRAGVTPWSGRHRHARSPRRASSRSPAREDCFAVRMSWGDQIEAPPETDSGAIERDEVTISFLSRLGAHAAADMTGIDAALDALVGSAAYVGRPAGVVPRQHRQHRRRARAPARRAVQGHPGRRALQGDGGLPPADPDREEQQIEQLRLLAEQSGLDPAFTEAFLRFIVSEVIRHHERLAAELES